MFETTALEHYRPWILTLSPTLDQNASFGLCRSW
jgi:hypothetical protein